MPRWVVCAFVCVVLLALPALSQAAPAPIGGQAAVLAAAKAGAADDDMMAKMMAIMVPILIGILILFLISIVILWKLFEKADEPGWAALIPVYNTYVLMKICNMTSGGYIALLIGCLVPCLNYICGPALQIILSLRLAKVFGKEVGFAIGLIFLSPIFLAILAFGDARYLGPEAADGDVPRRRRPRRRDDDDDDYEDDDRPRSRRRVDEDDDDDRPRRKRSNKDDEDDEEGEPRPRRR